MLVILYPEARRQTAETIAADLRAAYKDRLEIALVSSTSTHFTKKEPAWDDLLVVLFDEATFSLEGNQFINSYLERPAQTQSALPVALHRDFQKPPGPLEGIKALSFDATAAGADGRLAKRVGAMLGLRVQSRDNQIFISYRTADGKHIATQLYDHLRLLGYQPWQDAAPEFDQEPMVLPGSPVQKQIDEALSKATLVLLLDTPSAPHSNWIKHEIDTANALLLPILPLCFREPKDKTKGPRFASLRALQRWVSFDLPDPEAEAPLRPDGLSLIVSEMEDYLAEIFRRKCRVPFLVEKEFISRQFAWRVLDQRFLMFESSKMMSRRISLKVLSHCSVFEQVHAPALKKLSEYFVQAQNPNYALFIYDGEELLPEPELQEIVDTQGGPSIILHHQELAALIDSNFTTLTA